MWQMQHPVPLSIIYNGFSPGTLTIQTLEASSVRLSKAISELGQIVALSFAGEIAVSCPRGSGGRPARLRRRDCPAGRRGGNWDDGRQTASLAFYEIAPRLQTYAQINMLYDGWWAKMLTYH